MRCSIRCPEYFVENGDSCGIPDLMEAVSFTYVSDCEDNGFNCVKSYTSVSGCPKYFDFVDGKCLGRCPFGWKKKGNDCIKGEGIHLGIPTYWINEDGYL